MISSAKQNSIRQPTQPSTHHSQLSNKVTEHYYALVGLACITAVGLLYILKIKWPRLIELQANDGYKQLTGLFILTLIIGQWQLAINRLLLSKRSSNVSLSLHRWIGALMPLIFYFHSSHPGYGYQTLLISIFLGNSFIGLINPKTCGKKIGFIIQTGYCCIYPAHLSWLFY